MAKKVPYTLPLQERIPKPRNLHRASQLLILALLFSFLFYRLSSLQTHVHLNYNLSLLAFFCETWFSFVWIITMILEWNPIEYKTYPQRLLKRVESDLELPSVDMFVTTTDHLLEPPIITVNTVLSLLAIDYPANKLACYISDDGGSVVTFYSLVEASKFAQMWVPFCRKYEVEVRAPFMYFSDTEKAVHGSSPDFIKEWRKMKTEYEALRQRITHAIQNPNLSEFMGDKFAAFSNIERGNHPSIVKVELEEVKEAVISMPGDKAPGPDGFLGLFYQSCWDIIIKDLFKMVKDFFGKGKFVSELNATSITIIPKKPETEAFSDFRPINLCNFAYKIISKVMANRLKGVLDKLILEEQSMFVLDRQTANNIIVAYEMLHSLPHQHSPTSGIALKLDTVKAYDRVEWDFLAAIMKKFSFSD